MVSYGLNSGPQGTVMTKQCYGVPIKGVVPDQLKGKLIVVEGADGSGRSTQITNLTTWLEQVGHAVVNVGLKRSTLISSALIEAQEGNVLSKTTMSLFYATDFADQLENKIIPSLKAGAIVICDRYIYTLMARDIVRGAAHDWIEKIYSFAIVPDIVFYLQVHPEVLVERNLEKHNSLNYWESGMDLGLSQSLFDSFIIYQRMITREFITMRRRYGFHLIDGNRSVNAVQKRLQKKVAPLLSMVAEDVK